MKLSNTGISNKPLFIKPLNTYTMEAMTKKQRQVKDLTEFAQILKDNGFAVLVSAKHPFEWLHICKGGKFGYVQANYYGGFDFSTVYKPCKNHGSGAGVLDMVDLTIANAEKSLYNPHWNYSPDIKQYKDVDSFINATENKWAEYYIL